ncbi:glycosyltransferase family 4 protein [Alysiella crassa]|uniref:GDP-mannose-dependent alpha-(1-6)-phosphatidylinositol monomannoside mannosyltransferase n=1 Tax=Alysiella crassa TaxID=153491 RepID=A0A376BV76_9NEIS|nr:glycosyltransferase family 4 protein [Alysiella crassa]UOP06234.1 glycosyltransferase family 4 protein [Alysiella crassa]SSY80718.1 GDP-mannose-dependent alpha-(1-6)-phosphatidylinositol monomannoside mannosyltransferase [Alysiella crassa]
MKIVHANLARGFRGGERQTVTLIQALSQQYPDIQQVLLCRADSPMREMLKNREHIQFVDANKQWQGHFAIGQADVIHAHEAKAVHWAWLHHLVWKTPYLITRRVDFPLKNNFLGKQTFGNAHAIIAISQAIQTRLQSFSQNVDVITDAYSRLPENPPTIEKLQKQFANRFVIGHIGALVDSHKGQLDLLQVARQFRQQYPDCVFLFLGQGADEAMLKAQSADLDNVHWLGFQTDVGSYLAVMDLFVFPSRTEGLGSALLDAMVYNVPIIASRVGGIPDIIQHENNGLLFETGQTVQLAEQIEKMYHNSVFRLRCAAAAKQQLANFSPENMAAKYMVHYQNAVRAT